MKSNPSLTLYMDDLWISPYPFSVFCALREKKIDFDVYQVHFEKAETVDPAFRGKTFTDLIPAIEHNGVFLSESLAILEYLEECFSIPHVPRIFPKDLLDRTRARGLMNWYRGGFIALRDERSAETVFFESERAKKPLSPAATEEAKDFFKALRTYLKPGAEYLFGDWCIADTETALMLNRMIQNGDAVDDDLKAYAKRVWTRTSTHEFVSHRRKPYQSYYK